MRVGWLFVAAFALASLPRAQSPTPCPAGSAVVSYAVRPIENTFASIVGQPGTIVLFGFSFPPVDDASTAVTLPPTFPFAYYGISRTALSVCSNGFVEFTASGQPSFTNEHPGDAAQPNDAAMPWHDDLYFPFGGSRVAYNVGFYGPDTLAIEWRFALPRSVLPGFGLPFSFQCVLYASSHATLPDAVEFRYDRSSLPSPVVPCGSGPFASSTLAVSATVGLDSPSAIDASNHGVDATERGAANATFPPNDLRLLPASFHGSDQDRSFVASLVPQEPYCSIAGSPGTNGAGAACDGPDCYENDNSARLQGVQIALPWKFTLAGRPVRHANMNSNGYLQLGGGTFSIGSANGSLPDPGEPDAVLAPFWDDLEGTLDSAGMYWRVDGAPGCRVMTFEWKQMTRAVPVGGNCSGGPGLVSFQVRLFEGGAGSGGCPAGGIPPGLGIDRFEFLYDHAAFVPGPFTATIGFENAKGTLGGLALPGTGNAAPPPGFKWVVEPCGTGTVRYFGTAATTAPARCVPEIRTNGVPPRIGNPFELQLVGASPGAAAVLLLHFGGAIAGTDLPVPCGGLASPFGAFWVDPAAPLTLAIVAIVSGSEACRGFALAPLPIPLDPTLVGGTAYAQWATLSGAPPAWTIELSEGASVVVGG